MNTLSNKFNEITGIAVRPQDFILKDGHLLLAPYGAAGVTFEEDGSWNINDGDTFSIRFVQGYYEEFDAFGEYLKGIDFGSLQVPIAEAVDQMDEDLERWRFREEELSIAAHFLASYNAGWECPNAYILGTFKNAFASLADQLVNGDSVSPAEDNQENSSDANEEFPSYGAEDGEFPF